MEPAVFLDRDGTLIPDDADAGMLARVRLSPGVAPALRRLRDAGFRLVVATNQGGVARGRFTEVEVDAVHARLSELLDQETGLKRTIERFYYCPFHPKGVVPEYTREHPWRKPRPGMLLQAAQDMELDLERSWVVGDAPRDVEAGRAAGARTVLVSRDRERIADAAPDFSAGTLEEAVELILRHRDEARAAAAPAERRRARGTRRRIRRDRDAERLRRALADLAEEVRSLRLRGADTSVVRLAAMAMQLVAILLAAAAFLNLADFETFGRWAAAAVLVQLMTATVLLFQRP